MFHNVGKVDRIIRLILALLLVVMYYLKIADGRWDTYFLFGAVILFFTSMRRCCPLYALLGFGTCGIDQSEKKPLIETKKINLK